MRTNPFLDTWLFILGLTDVPYAEGAFKYAFAILFFGLLAAAAFIAFVNWRKDPAQRSRTHIAICICRVLVGCMWFQGCLWKLPWPIADGFRYWTEQMAQYAAFGFHRALVTNVYLPYLSVIDPLVFLAELSFAISLILGFAVPFFAVLAALFSLHLWLGLYLHPSEWPWSYIFLALIHVLFAVCAAGRSLGLDAYLHRRDITGFARAFG
jgi:uncharacterized membrane protein YphA (DoxX/SURF4 family)